MQDPLIPGERAKAEVLFGLTVSVPTASLSGLMVSVLTASLTWIGQTWGQAGRRRMLQKARGRGGVLGRHGRQEGRWKSGPRVWSVVNGPQLPGLCPILVGCYSEQSHGWAQLGPGEAWLQPQYMSL